MSRTWDVAIVGAGYVGLPLAQTFADAGKRVLILDVVPEVAYHDPHVPAFGGMTSSPLEPESYDCVAIVTAHSSIDYAELVRRAKVVVDFRNATHGHEVDGKVWKL